MGIIPSLDAFFKPKSVAIVGASSDPKKVGHTALKNLVSMGYQGKIFPINPREDSILGLSCYKSVLDIPEPVEACVLLISADFTMKVARELVQRKSQHNDVTAAICMSAGFGELGTPEGKQREHDLVQTLRPASIRLIGPNCVGMIDAYSGFNTNFDISAYPKGGVSILTQSGAFANSLLFWAERLRLIGISDYQPTIHAFFLSSGAQMQQLVGETVDGRSRPVEHAVFSVVNPNRLHLTHEICHEVVSNVWGAAEPWIEEGLAVYADEGANAYYDSWELLNSRNLIPLDKLVDPEWKSSMYPADTTYPELGSFIKFLDDRYGVESIRRIWQGGSQSIPQVVGKPLAELERDWRDSLVKQFPERPTRHYRRTEAGLWIE